MSMLVPTKVTVLAYHVGFGDCVLVRFHYQDRCRHVLIDFGTTAQPVDAPEDYMAKIAGSIVQECAGKLEALVATHRHADHISGFGTEDGPGSIIAACKPDLIVQPWTEDPNAAEKATHPTAAFLKAIPGLGEKALRTGRGFVGRMDAASLFLAGIRVQARSAKGFGADSLGLRNELMFLGEIGLKNASAVKNLIQMSSNRRYVYFGADSGFDESLLPGVKVTVLGPPTLDQTQTIRSQTTTNPNEFWMLASPTKDVLADGSTGRPPDAEDVPAYARWLRNRLNSLGGREQLAFVRQLDGVMNNTSVILLFETGPAKLLFPGDAQIENWSYALQQQQPDVKKLLQDVNLYKVGHHGSRNATPKTLWRNFAGQSEDPGDPGRLITILSTRSGKHGSKSDNTEVPRHTLVAELERHSKLVNTEKAGVVDKYYSPVDIECQ